MPSASLGCHQDTELLEISLINLSKCGWVGGVGWGSVVYKATEPQGGKASPSKRAMPTSHKKNMHPTNLTQTL